MASPSDMRGLLALYEEVVRALDAGVLIRAAASRAPQPAPGGKLLVLGLGKVAAEMVSAVPGERNAIVVAPIDAPAPSGARVLRGGHPLPDASSLEAGESLLAAAGALKPADAALLLISGGGSALAEAPHPELSLADVREINQALLTSGAPIEEMNCVRAHLSRLKGGGLARALHAAGVRRARALVLVDVPQGGPAAVSSGPFAADPTTFADAREIVRRRRVALPQRAVRLLEGGPSEETLKPGDPADFIEHVALCDMRAPAEQAARLSRSPARVGPLVRGPVSALPEQYERAAGPGLFAASGEPELAVPPDAPPGGRAQHLALLMARALRGRRAGFLAAGTDGRDGATSAAGAAVDGSTWDEAERRGLEPARALSRFDAASCLQAVGATIPSFQSGAHAG